MGRHKINISIEEFEKLCALQCGIVEIAEWFKCTTPTIEAWCKRTYKDASGNGMTFAQVFEQKRGTGKISLRRAQFQLAKKSAAMAIFLGKQYLGQTDGKGRKQEPEVLEEDDEL